MVFVHNTVNVILGVLTFSEHKSPQATVLLWAETKFLSRKHLRDWVQVEKSDIMNAN